MNFFITCKNSLLLFVGISFSQTIVFAQEADKVSRSYLEQVFFSPSQRTELSRFLDAILMQVSSRDFFKMVDTILEKKQGKSDEELYIKLLQHVGKIKPTFSAYYLLKSLSAQKSILSLQVKELLPDKHMCNGCVEIGTPGTYISSITSFVACKGTTYGVYDEEQYSHYFKSYGSLYKQFLSYDRFVSLEDYDPIAAAIADNSIDIVVCFIGLHHIPQEKLDAFIASIHRILRSGGIFLLREYDACNDDRIAMVHAAHSVFNLIIADSLEEEIEEYRNFKPLSEWIQIVEAQGFVVSDQRLVQEADPTYNTMIKFTKIEKKYTARQDNTTNFDDNVPADKKMYDIEKVAPDDIDFFSWLYDKLCVKFFVPY